MRRTSDGRYPSYGDGMGKGREEEAQVEAADAPVHGPPQHSLQRPMGGQEGSGQLHRSNHAVYGRQQGRLLQREFDLIL